jgi:ParB family chromosome partitioning protein
MCTDRNARASYQESKDMESKLVENVPVGRIKSRGNIRERLVEEEQVALAESVKINGILVPLLGHREGEVVVVDDGHRRLDAAIRAGLETVPMLVSDHVPTRAELLMLQLIANCARSGLKTMERVRGIDGLMRESGWPASEVSRRLDGPSEASISRLLALLVLPREVQDLIDAGRIPISSAYAIATVPDAAERDRLIAEVLNGRLTRDKVVAVVKARKSGNGRSQPLKRSKTRGARVVVPLGGGCSIAFKTGVTLQTFVSWLVDLSERFRRFEPQIELAEAVKALAGKE